MQKNKTILREFFKYSLLNVMGMIGLSCYILADTLFIAKGLGTNGLAALNIAIPVYSFIYGLGLMVAIGAATRYSILKHNNEKLNTDNVFSQSLIFSMLLSVLFVVLGVFFSVPVAKILGASENIIEITAEYLKIIFIFTPAFMLNSLLQSFIRNDDNPRLAMAAMLLGSFSNIVLDYFFVIEFKLGMQGAAFATGIAPLIGIFISSFHFIKKKNNFKFIKTSLRLETIRDMMSLGTGTLINELSSGIVIMTLNIIIMKISGDIGVAAYAVIANIAVVVIAIFTGIAQGIQPLISSSYGKNDVKSIGKIYKYGIIMSIVFSVIIYVVSFVFAEPITMLFNSENNAQLTKIAVEGIRIYFTAFLFAGINLITSIFFSSIDKPKQSITISLLRAIIVIIPTALIMSSLFGMQGVWLSLPISEMITFVIAIIIFLKLKKQMVQ